MTGTMTTFEGSFGGDHARISDAAVLECKICWTPYDPALGDETRQVPPGTAFRLLPADWRCPICDGERAGFMVASDPSHDDPSLDDPALDPAAREAALVEHVRAAARALVADFEEVYASKMRGLPMSNPELSVEAIGFRPYGSGGLGVLLTPWFMNLVLVPGPDEDWSALETGAKEVIALPSGRYEFVAARRPCVGGYKACSLFSPMGDFKTAGDAISVAQAVMIAVFDPAHRDVPERDRAQAEADAKVAAEREARAAPSRRGLITGRLATPPAGEAAAPGGEA